jgi:hypothetical protein
MGFCNCCAFSRGTQAKDLEPKLEGQHERGHWQQHHTAQMARMFSGNIMDLNAEASWQTHDRDTLAQDGGKLWPVARGYQ